MVAAPDTPTTRPMERWVTESPSVVVDLQHREIQMLDGLDDEGSQVILRHPLTPAWRR
ncbi:MAG: hypothetical protein IID39_04000 [Planctomycetes bacterium]|nr:hypothetical protein [Planctomycetota bacterium]